MTHKTILKHLLCILALLSFTALAEAASPVWTFTPLTPTTVTPPATVQYRVTNQSPKPHTLVLSPTEGVTQVTTTGNCSDAFTLTLSNPSCILTLNISEKASNSTRHSAPTVCEQGPNGQASSFQCYRPSPADIIQIIPQTRQQMAYVPNYGNNTLSICPVETNGDLGVCSVTDGNGTIFDPFAAAINTSGTFIYIVNFGNWTLSTCPIHTDGMLGTCTVSNGDGAFSAPSTISINPDSTYAYINNIGGQNLSICPLNTDGSLGTCQNYSNLGNTGSTFNITGSLIYRLGTSSLEYCTLNPDGSLATCTPSGSGIVNAFGISLNASNAFVYIANRTDEDIFICPLNPDGSLGACVIDDAGGTLNFSQGRVGLFMTSSTDYGYIPNRGNNTVSICSILDNGSLNACHAVNDSTFDEPAGVALFPV
tara:strand:+ start:135364 stop:136635 length:1272 start_codon:yes stop_codon:yes gene_type:complete